MAKMADLTPTHFDWQVRERVARVRLNRPDRKNPLTFDSYAELRDTFRALVYAEDVDVVVFASNEGNFCSGGDVHDIIGPLTKMNMKELLAFTRMTGDLVKAMIGCGKPIISAVDGVAVGAGAIITMASDMRLATPEAKCAFLFTRVGLAGCDMGACAMLPRIIGQGRAAELLYTGRTMRAEDGLAWGYWNALHPADQLEDKAMELAEGQPLGGGVVWWRVCLGDQPDLIPGDRLKKAPALVGLADIDDEAAGLQRVVPQWGIGARRARRLNRRTKLNTFTESRLG